jgi:long-chain fatty acid transport protein
MNIALRLASFGCFAAAAVASLPASAQGLFSGTKGARAAGRNGAYVAKADDLYAVDYNPAGLASIDGWVVQISDRLSYNQSLYDRAPTKYNNSAPEPDVFGRVENGAPFQALDPFLSIGTDFGLDSWGFALAAYAPPGTARMKYPLTNATDPVGRTTDSQRYMMVSREAEILNYTASAAYKFKDLFGVGLTAQWVHVPRLEYSLVVAPVVVPNSTAVTAVRSSNDAQSTVSGSDPFSANLIAGAWVKPTPFLEAGLSATIPVTPQIMTSSRLDLVRVGGAPIALTRDGTPANDVTVVVPLPLIFRGGLRYIHKKAGKPLWDVELDFSFQTWSRVRNLVVDSRNLIGTDAGERIPVGVVQIAKNWKDSFTVALGGDYSLLPDRLTVRAGVGYESAVSDPSYQQIDFATGEHLSGSVGGSVHVGKFEIALSYGYRHMIPVRVSLDPAASNVGKVYQQAPLAEGITAPAPVIVNAGKYQSYSHQISVDGIVRF